MRVEGLGAGGLDRGCFKLSGIGGCLSLGGPDMPLPLWWPLGWGLAPFLCVSCLLSLSTDTSLCLSHFKSGRVCAPPGSLSKLQTFGAHAQPME